MLTSSDVLSEPSQRTFEFRPSRVQHVSDVVIQFFFIFFGPVVKGCTVREHSITRFTQVRVDCSQGSHCAFGLRALQTGGSILLSLLSGCQNAVDVFQALPLTRSTLQVVRWPAIHESAEVGDKERVLDVSYRCQSLHFGICSGQNCIATGGWVWTYRRCPTHRPC